MNFVDLLDRPIAYHRCFVRLTGSVTGAVLLSQSVYWQARSKHEGGWWFKTQADWQDETGLTRRELATAKAACKNFLESDVRGVPATTWYRVNGKALKDALYEGVLPVQTSMAESAKLDCTKAPNLNGGKRQTTNGTETTSEITSIEEAIYKAYPLKKGKPSALLAIRKALKNCSAADLLEKTEAFSMARNGDMAFCPHPATWFNDERYNDDPSTWNPRQQPNTNQPRNAI